MLCLHAACRAASGGLLQFKSEKGYGCAVREAHAVAVHVTSTRGDDFHYHSVAVSIQSGNSDDNAVAQLKARLARLEGVSANDAQADFRLSLRTSFIFTTS